MVFDDGAPGHILFLVLEPKLAEGETIEGSSSLSHLNASAAPQADTDVRNEENAIVIGGVKLKKRLND